MELSQDYVVSAVLDFLNGGILPDGLNDTPITRVPKVWNLQKISQYRPIFVYSVLYKIGVKCIVTDYSAFSMKLSEEKGVFMHGRLITDNV